MKPKDPPEDIGVNFALLANLKAKEGGGDLECQRCGSPIPREVGTGTVRYYLLTLFGPPAGVGLTLCLSCGAKLKILSSAVYAMLSDGERKVTVTLSSPGTTHRKKRR